RITARDLLYPSYELLSRSALLAGPIGGDLDAASFKRSGAELELQVSRLAPIDARGLIIGRAQPLGDDAHGHAQGCLAEAIFGVEFCALAGEVFDDVVQSLIGRTMQRRPAELAGHI